MSECRNVCMLFQNSHAHPSHQIFAESVTADYLHFETGLEPIEKTNQDQNRELSRLKNAFRLPRRYDVVIAEGTAPLQTLILYKMFRNPSVTAIYLAADETFHFLPNKPTRHIWRTASPIINRTVDGVVAVGSDVVTWSRPFIGNLPTEIVHPPIDNEKYERLSRIESCSPQSEFIVLSAGLAKPANNYHTLVAACRRLVEQQDISMKLVLLGEGHTDQEYAQDSHVKTPGYVELDEFVDWFKRASIYVQPSIGDSFPVATLEGILSGTPTLVTNDVGVRELLPDNQIVDSTLSGLMRGLVDFYRMSQEEREELATGQRSLVEDFTESIQQQRFRAALDRLC